MIDIPRRRSAALALATAVLGAAALAACKDTVVGEPVPAGSGTLRVQLTDAPMDTSLVRSVDVYVVRVDARAAGTDADSASADSGTGDEDKGRGGWTTIAEPKAKIDLLALRGGRTTQLGEEPLAAGSYRAFRMIIDPAQSSITLNDGTVLTGTSSPGVHFPSAGRSGIKIQLARPVTVGADSTSTMLIDFDARESFVMKGPNMKSGLTFKPVIHAMAK
jgi:hypothetical protein